MKRLQIFVFSVFLIITAFGQENKKIELNWKLSAGDTIIYKLIMAKIDSPDIKYNLRKLFNLASDSLDENYDETTENIYEELNNLDIADSLAILTSPKKDIINIDIIAKAVKDIKKLVPDSLKKYLEYMPEMNSSQSVLLRGSIYKTGGIHSFWLKKGQKNLLALLFELPSKAVKIGDSWDIEVNFISFDQYFKCDSSFKSVKVTLADVKTTDNDTIATVKYDITEYVDGTYFIPSLFSAEPNVIDVIAKVIYQATAEFSVTKGRWISYEGILQQYSKGIIDADIVMRYALEKY